MCRKGHGLWLCVHLSFFLNSFILKSMTYIFFTSLQFEIVFWFFSQYLLNFSSGSSSHLKVCFTVANKYFSLTFCYLFIYCSHVKWESIRLIDLFLTSILILNISFTFFFLGGGLCWCIPLIILHFLVISVLFFFFKHFLNCSTFVFLSFL